MNETNWYSFGALSDDDKKKFLIRIKSVAQKSGRTNLILYNKYAEQFGLEKIKPIF